MNGQEHEQTPAPDETPQPLDGEETSEAAPEQRPGPAWEADLDRYPVRPPQEDPRWAFLTVVIWFAFAVASFVFMVTLVVLGIFYD